MLKALNPLSQVCGNCSQENIVDQALIQNQTQGITIMKLPACPNCGSQEFLAVLTLDQNPWDHASLVRELAANLGLIQRTDPLYFR